MTLKKFTGILVALFALHLSASAQTAEVHIQKLMLNKKEKKVFNQRDSSMTIYIDTLIMNDKASLQFFGKKDIKLVVKHAEIGNNVNFFGTDNKNNGTNFDIAIKFHKLGSLFVLAKGETATNGYRTYPNGNSGNITLTYDNQGLTPQSKDKNAKQYLVVDVTPGGLNITPSSDISLIYSRIRSAPAGLRGISQGQIYSGSPGVAGKVIIQSNEITQH